MSDWGATHSTAKAAMAGLDQQSGYPFDDKPYFGELLLKAVQSGELSEARLTEMARRILRTMFAKGVIDYPVESATIDYAAHAEVTRRAAEQGAVLLKNEGAILPLNDRSASPSSAVTRTRACSPAAAHRWCIRWVEMPSLASSQPRGPGRCSSTRHRLCAPCSNWRPTRKWSSRAAKSCGRGPARGRKRRRRRVRDAVER